MYQSKTISQNYIAMTQQTTAVQFKGFRTGMAQVLYKDYRAIVKELLEALGITNRVSFYSYRDGNTIPRADKAVAVEAVFNRYGITNIWDA